MRERYLEMTAKRASEKVESPRVFGQARKPAKMFRAGLYARVSTNDQQTIPLQIRALREYAVRRGWCIAMQVKEVGSGASQRQLREKLLEAARRREIDVVLVWRLDRWGRSVADLLATLQELQHLGVGFVSLTEALDLTTPAGRDGRATGCIRGVRKRNFAGTRARRVGPRPTERQETGSAGNRGAARF
jgi:DNA invertase Pin-like site-specific DNA recombinase